jgi:tetrapyrrole methylase family protein/MazG family protein
MHPIPAKRRAFQALVEIVAALRGPEGCPWDIEQTHQTLTRFAIEEAHELAEAIDKGDREHIKEELGDLLLQVVLHAEIAKQAGTFTLEDIIEGICNKMVRRHPHVFSDASAKSSEEVLEQWSKIKALEKPKGSKGFDLPPALPALMAAQKIGEKTRKMNFDFINLKEVLKKVHEEIEEFEEAAQSGDQKEMAAELGDIFFSVAQLARFFGADAEQVARQANQRFERRFVKMQELAQDNFIQLSATKKEHLWQAAKKATQ